MTLIENLRQAGPAALQSLIISLLPLAMAIFYAMRPSEQRLAYMRPLSLAAIFGALAALLGGISTVLRGIGATGQFTTHTFDMIAMGASTTLIPAFVCFGCLAVSWLLVALGMQRAGHA